MLEIKNIPYLSQQLPAYIGNKRSLLSFLHDVFTKVTAQYGGNLSTIRFFDGFAGTGSVSRLAKYMGFSVFSNDWEHYSWIMNSSFLKADHEFKINAFKSHKSFWEALSILNDATQEAKSPIQYIQKYYAPAKTDSADYRKERLFYSQENAQFLDRTRQLLEEWYPGWDLDPETLLEKQVFLSLIIYQAATHANTSGVFKAYHKGFGGHSKDALKRILNSMQLIDPELWSGPATYTTWNEDVIKAASRQSFDLVYLDPPYNIHQYGSNYFMLNSISKWDFPDPQFEKKNGALSVKAGIRTDWKETWSPFCSPKTAAKAMEDLLNALDAPVIALSYNTEGIIEFEELVSLLSKEGAVNIEAQDYITYRGGRQSPGRKISNMEMVLILDRRKKQSSYNRFRLDQFVLQKKLSALENSYIDIDKLYASFPESKLPKKKTPINKAPSKKAAGLKKVSLIPELVELRVEHDCYIDSVQADISELVQYGERKMKDFWKEILKCLPQSHQERVGIILSLLEKKAREVSFSSTLPKSELKFFKTQAKHLLWSLRKFAYRKYQEDFEKEADSIEALFQHYPQLFPNYIEELEELRELAYNRIQG